MPYDNLDLRIQADGDGFAVVAQRGSQSVREDFDPAPLGWTDLKELEARGDHEIRRYGSALFNALIRGKVRDLYQQGRGNLGNDAARGLRIRIIIDLRDPRLRPLMRVPWEILYDPSADASQLLALDARRAIVRMIESSEPSVEPPAGPLRRVLLVAANPVDTTRLNLDNECMRAEEALSRMHIRPDVLRGATRSALYDRIRDREPQIVHFMGHGMLDATREEGALLLEGKDRNRDVLHASTFATFFAGGAMPRLVVLNACLTAAEGRAETFEAFSSVATALIAAGLPAVIAMQSTIRDNSACRFTERLYGGLVANKPIEAAVSDARAALSSMGRYMLDWAAPVLYLTAQGGGRIEAREPDARQRAQAPQGQAPASTAVEKNYGVVIIGPVSTVTSQVTSK
jgi:hypothetical protein